MIYSYKPEEIDFDSILEQLKIDQNRKVRTRNKDILYRYEHDYFIKYHNDQQRLLWMTKNNMVCGFNVSHELIDFEKVDSFIDVGCGTGNYFIDVLSKHKIRKVVGVDATPNFIQVAKEKTKDFQITYIVDNIFNIPEKEELESYDLCTLNGVLQTLDLISIGDVFNIIITLINKGGQLWITTLNYHKVIEHFWSSDNRRFVGLWKYKFEELIYYMKNDFQYIKYGFYNPDSKLVEEKDKGDFVFVYGIKS